MRIAWIMGWAVPEAWFAPWARGAFPHAEHGFFEPGPNWLAHVGASGPWDAIAGYSLGSLLVSREAAAVGRLAPRVALLAPVLAFASEEGLGGRFSRAQVKFLARRLRSDRKAALIDFYRGAGLSGCDADALTASDGLLQWGLERLADDRAELPLPKGWRVFAGEADVLLDAETLARVEPAVVRVAGAMHHPDALMRAWAADQAATLRTA